MAIVMLGACSTLDCPQTSTVMAKFRMGSPVDTLKDTLTISAARPAGNDSVLINKDVNRDSFMLPMSYNGDEVTYYFSRTTIDGDNYIDTVRVMKTNEPHFESVDCTPSVFHTITGVSTTHHAIDSISIIYNKVTYDQTKAHFRIYFTPLI